MNDLTSQRRFYAEEIQATGNLKTVALVDALATIHREQFLRSGPWLIRAEGDLGGPPRHTPNADPKHVYHNVSVAIDPARHLYNGAPGVVAMAIDALALERGQSVLQIGCGLGYYSAVMAHIVGPAGYVLSVEVDEDLAREASRNLSVFSWVGVQHGNGTEPLAQPFDAILVSAGVTHPHDIWLDALVTGGRLVLPLTATMPLMGTIGKGPMILLTKVDDQTFDISRIASLVAGYSAVGLRDDSLNEALGRALMRAPFVVPKRLRRDRHEPGTTCWLHASTFCLASE